MIVSDRQDPSKFALDPEVVCGWEDLYKSDFEPDYEDGADLADE